MKRNKKLKVYLQILIFTFLLVILFESLDNNNKFMVLFDQVLVFLMVLFLFLSSLSIIIIFSKFYEEVKLNISKYSLIKNIRKSQKSILLNKITLFLLPLACYRVNITSKIILDTDDGKNFLISLTVICALAVILTYVSYFLIFSYLLEAKKRNLTKKEELWQEIIYSKIELEFRNIVELQKNNFLENINLIFEDNIRSFLLIESKKHNLIINARFSLLLSNKKKASTPPDFY
ncbi:hypothetical protein [Spiroplasma tabanidicola]|uniref:Transmembrane protein n=1 Tax=Spiroplasma tabanidicola TaxID=324079 RepID=A0A6I6CBJ4_9MOLU|nr:hypothetical protein [Spiroplasma tabanidicola]QGS51558.1 hypothetical protein STABA_v1c01910 [Spiroplasma tabanidicola]